MSYWLRVRSRLLRVPTRQNENASVRCGVILTFYGVLETKVIIDAWRKKSGLSAYLKTLVGSSKLKMYCMCTQLVCFFPPTLHHLLGIFKASTGQRVNLIFLSLRLKRANPENSWSGWVEIDTTDEVTFGFWNGKPGLAFSDICLATEMHLEGREKKGNKCGGG